jgi:trans-aconitate methyltransferase
VRSQSSPSAVGADVGSSSVDWRSWYERWEASQDCYIPEREARFDLMFAMAELAPDVAGRILDLGCGPGSVSFRGLRHYPEAEFVAVDSAPVLLEMGRAVSAEEGWPVQFVEEDLRSAEWWESLEERFDLVVSATALHWLSAENLAAVYRRIHSVLRPGCWFFNCDHVASDDPATQGHFRRKLSQRREAVLRESNCDSWDGYWEQLGAELGDDGTLPLSLEHETWEGTEDGHTERFHLTTLRDCGFQQVGLFWRKWGEAVIGGRKRQSDLTAPDRGRQVHAG